MGDHRRLVAATRCSGISIAPVIAAAWLAMATGSAHAGLLGATVDVSARYPTDATVFDDPGSVLVTAGVEYPAGSFAIYGSSWEVDIQDNQLLITDATASGLPFTPAQFNGFVLSIVLGPAIQSATIDDFSTIVPAHQYVEGGRLYLDFAGVDATPGGTAVIDFTTGGAVPEPATWMITLAGFAGLRLAGRRTRRKVASTA